MRWFSRVLVGLVGLQVLESVLYLTFFRFCFTTDMRRPVRTFIPQYSPAFFGSRSIFQFPTSQLRRRLPTASSAHPSCSSPTILSRVTLHAAFSPANHSPTTDTRKENLSFSLLPTPSGCQHHADQDGLRWNYTSLLKRSQSGGKRL